MKKAISLFSTISILLVMLPTVAFANEKNTTDSYIDYFEDGSYIVTEIETSTISTFSTSSTSKTKTSTYYDDNDNKLWTICLAATFSYTGSSATCTKATTSYSIYNSYWKVTKGTASRSGRTATGDFTVKKYVLGVPVKTINKTLTLTCSNTGVCS